MSSEILNQLLADIKTAMKARESDRLQALRFLHSQIKNVEVDQRREVTDEDVADVVQKSIKARVDAIEQFKAGGREDLAAKEQAEIDLYRAYQPAQLDEAEIEAIVDEAIQTSGATGKRDMGKVMKEVMPRTRGRADGKVVSSTVNRKLGELEGGR